MAESKLATGGVGKNHAVRIFSLLALVLGLGFGLWLIGHYSFAAVGAALASVGWLGFMAIILIHLAIAALCGIAWSILIERGARPPAWVFVAGRLVREGASDVLPLSQVGGLVMGARAAALAGLSGAIAFASTLVDATIELLGQILFAGVALGLLGFFHPDSGFVGSFAIALVAALAIAILFILVQHRSLSLIENLADRLAAQWAETAAASLGAARIAIKAIYSRRRAVSAAFALHFFCWLAGAMETWLALALMGRMLEPWKVVAIEGLLNAARGLAFAIPNALGVQEAAYIVLGGLFGLGPDVSLALSLLKRARGIAIGVPALVSWQFAESSRILRRR